MAWNGAEKDRVFAKLEATLGRAGWRVRKTRSGVRARWRWLSVTLKRKARRNQDAPFRARLRDGFPATTIAEHWKSEPGPALDIVIEHARSVQKFEDGDLGLVRNPSKGWLSHRLWQAVRPFGSK